MTRVITFFMCAVFAAFSPVFAQELSGLARFDATQSTVTDMRRGARIDLHLSQGVPYRVFTLNDPARLVMDFREVDWSALDVDAFIQGDVILDARAGSIRPGWSRMVLDLGTPLVLDSADMRLDEASGAAHLTLHLRQSDAETFAQQAGEPEIAGWSRPIPEGQASDGKDPFAPLVIVLDPGHGGIDPGAEVGEVVEKHLMLAFARELKEALLRRGDVEVILTRDDDSFVSLEHRVTVAHRAQADMFISLHADSLSEGHAKGATIYTLDEDASDAASAALAERHARDDLLAGVDLSQTDDVVADILMDLARMETRPRSDLLARAVMLSLREADLPINTHPIRSAGFSVLKSPGTPSVLLELGFLSNGRDRDNLSDAAWREHMAVAVADAIRAWAIADEAAAELVRQ